MATASSAGGRVIFTGDGNWSMIGRKAPTAAFDGITTAGTFGFKQAQTVVFFVLFLFLADSDRWKTQLAGLSDVRVRTVISGPTACHNIAIDVAGRVFVWGRNEAGQLGLGADAGNRYTPTLLRLPSQSPVVGGACGS